MKYLLLDCCPVPEKLYPVLKQIKDETGCTFASIYRGVDARALLNQCGKHDQAWLYANLPPGVANPPGRSSHELKSDGVAYAGPIGRSLQYWQCGMDVDDAHVAAFIAAAKKHGWVAFRPYTSGVEYHHVNFAKEPRFVGPLKVGSKGPRVWALTHLLMMAVSPSTKKPYLDHHGLFFSKNVENIVKKFQEDHKLTPDGTVGPHTLNTLKAAARRAQLARKAKKAKK